MSEKRKNVKLSKTSIVSPSRTVNIQTAHCPKGCDLMTDKVKIHNLNSICVKGDWGNQEGLVYLDPEFGSYEHVSEIDVPDGGIVKFSCPHCGTSLVSETETCHSCSSPVFTLILPKEGEVSACIRKGCFEHTLKIESFETMQIQFDNDFIKIIM
ncbi:MAG TPA: hypothetical protein DHW42_05225 [Candidatus Marinimicrobia bacterium]|nr:hypothetical protein [Candidatus Neomarinimicrobiota bacterium]